MNAMRNAVLILVLMEDTLREVAKAIQRKCLMVLILVLMEDTLRDNTKVSAKDILGLNPCFNGRYSQRR